MTLQVVYSVSAGVTSDLSSRVFMASERLGLPPFSITQNAEEGSVAHSTLVVDDPSGDLTLKGHRRIYFVETSAPTGQQVIGNTYVGPKEISRGDWQVGPLARTFSVSLQDANTLISRRLIVGSDGNRPAETDIARLTWLRATTEANEFNGPSTYISTTGPVAMDAVDYRGQSVTAILSDLSQASHKNWWVVYFESVGQFGLWYDFDYSAVYDSTISLSNDEADVDDSTVFAYFSTGTLTQDPSRVYSGTLVDFQPAATETTSWVYEQDIATGNEFVFRDVAYPSLNVKTETKARARARKYLAASDEEDDVIKVSFVVPAAKVNALMHGHRIQTKGTHLGFSSGNSYTSLTWMRCLTRTVTQLSSTHYRIDAELTGTTFVCSFVAPTVTENSSLDIFGSYIDKVGNNAVIGPTPQTVVAAISGPMTLYGTANVTATWGVISGVPSAGTTTDATWTWDLQSLGDIPYICTIAYWHGGSAGGTAFEDATTRIEASDDGVTWDVIKAYGTLSTGTPFAITSVQYRYWRMHHNYAHGGAYYQGTEYWEFLLWSAE